MLVPVEYKSAKINTELRCDFFVENILVVELKAVEKVLPIHEAQVLTYMRLLNSPEGLLINFNTYNIFSDGQKTYVNDLYRNLDDEWFLFEKHHLLITTQNRFGPAKSSLENSIPLVWKKYLETKNEGTIEEGTQ